MSDLYCPTCATELMEHEASPCPEGISDTLPKEELRRVNLEVEDIFLERGRCAIWCLFGG